MPPSASSTLLPLPPLHPQPPLHSLLPLHLLLPHHLPPSLQLRPTRTPFVTPLINSRPSLEAHDHNSALVNVEFTFHSESAISAPTGLSIGFVINYGAVGHFQRTPLRQSRLRSSALSAAPKLRDLLAWFDTQSVLSTNIVQSQDWKRPKFQLTCLNPLGVYCSHINLFEGLHLRLCDTRVQTLHRWPCTRRLHRRYPGHLPLRPLLDTPALTQAIPSYLGTSRPP